MRGKKGAVQTDRHDSTNRLGVQMMGCGKRMESWSSPQGPVMEGGDAGTGGRRNSRPSFGCGPASSLLERDIT